MSHFGATRVFVASSEKKVGRMSFLQAQRECFEGEEGEGAEEDHVARRLKEENDSRVDAILEAEAKRRQAKQDRADAPASKTTDERMKALQRLRSMEWKRNQQDHAKITREQVVQYEEVKSQRAAEEVFFEGTRQGKVKTRRKHRKEEVIHSLDGLTPKSTFPLQESKRWHNGVKTGLRSGKEDQSSSKRLSQAPPPPGNAWLQKKGSELFGSLGLTPSSVEEEEAALHKALAASMQSFYAEQFNTELTITRSAPDCEKNAEEKKSEEPWENFMPSLTAENSTYCVASQVYSSSPHSNNYDEEHKKKYTYRLRREHNFATRNSQLFREPKVAACKLTRKDKEYLLDSRTPEHKTKDPTNSCQSMQLLQHKNFESREENWEEVEEKEEKGKEEEEDEEEEEEEAQLEEASPECNMYNYNVEKKQMANVTEPDYSESVGSHSLKYNKFEYTAPHMAHSSGENLTTKEMYGNKKVNDIHSYRDLCSTSRTTHTLVSSSGSEPPSSMTSAEQTKINSSHFTNTANNEQHFSKTLPISHNSDEKPVENYSKDVEESSVDPSCFMLFEPVSAESDNFETASPEVARTAASISEEDQNLANSIPTPQEVAEPQQAPTSPYQEQYAAALSDLNNTLSSLKLQMQAYPSAGILRQPQPCAFISGNPPRVSPELPSPEAYMMMLGMYGSPWQQNMFQAGPMALEPRLQAAQFGMYGYSAPDMSQMDGAPIEVPVMQDSGRTPTEVPLVQDAVHTPGVPLMHCAGQAPAGMPLMHNAGQSSTGIPLMHNAGQSSTGMPLMHNAGQSSTAMPLMHNAGQSCTGLPLMHNTGIPLMHNASQSSTGMPLMQNTLNPSVPHVVPPHQFPSQGLFMQPSMYSVPCPGPDPPVFQNAMHMSGLSHVRPPGTNSMPFIDPQFASLQAANVPATSTTSQDPQTTFLYANGLPVASSSVRSVEVCKPVPPRAEDLMHRHLGPTYPQTQSFLNHHPLEVNGFGEQQPFPFVMQQPHVLNPIPVPFQSPPPEPVMGRGRGRLRH